MVVYSDELYHYGVKGMRWGHRKARPEASNSRKREPMTPEKKKKIGRRVAAVALSSVSVAAAAYYVHKNPEKIGKVISTVKNVKVKEISKKARDAGKRYVKDFAAGAKDTIKKAPRSMAKGFKEGIDEGLREAPKKVAKTLVMGGALLAAKKALDSQVGKENAAIIFQANDNKKIGKFWKVSPDDKDDKDDD